MKGNISRFSHRPEEHFSAVLQVQGGMVTDADLGEQAIIARGRTDGLGHDAVGGGVPVEGGAVEIDTDGLPTLTEGVVYAEGVRGHVRSTRDEVGGPLGLYAAQVDFPLAPDIAGGEQVVYVDIWERMVSSLEDPLLADAGLHGVETAFRARTMTQIKVAALEDIEAISTGSGRFPRIGTGRLSVAPVDPETIIDTCDPCADVVTEAQMVTNTLFRIEILRVRGDADDPRELVVAWSAENGSAIAPADVNTEDFERAGAVYEFFSPVTESHLGVHPDSGDAQVSTFTADLDVDPPATEAPEGGVWPFVRRWDGIAQVDMSAGTVEQIGTGPLPVLVDDALTITTDAFAATIAFNDAAVVAGDYWLIETRRFSDEPIRVVQDTPIGILHHYCPLFRIADRDPQELTDQERRKLSFPALMDLPASHIGLDNTCEKLFGDAENVQDALDNLCSISADDIAFDPTGCPRLYDSATDVQAALDNLCRVDFGNERVLRFLHDWGVVCGVIPRFVGRRPPEVSISAGQILDRSGQMGSVDAFVVDLNSLVGTEFFLFDSLDSFANEFAEGGVCLALAIAEGGVIQPYLVPKDQAFEPANPSFLSVLTECMQENPPFQGPTDLSDRPAAERAALDKVFYGAANENLAGSQRLNGREFQLASSFNDNLIAEYRGHVNNDADVETLDRRLSEIDREIDVEGATGEVRETRRLQRESLRFRAVQESNLERFQRCLCEALLPRCPILDDAPHLVPIGCVEGFVEGREIFLRRVCAYDCRKQAMSWRMINYYIPEVRAAYAQRLAEACCATPTPPQGGGGFTNPNLGLAQSIPLEAANDTGFFTERVDKSFSILTGQQPANEVTIKPDVGNLAQDQAERVLIGNGIEITETIDLGNTNAVQTLRDRSVGIDPASLVLDAGKLQPGDKVALLIQDGVAVDYIKVEQGPGKFLFEKGQAADTVPPVRGDDGFFVPIDPGRDVATDPTRPGDLTGGRDLPRLDEAEAATRALEERLQGVLDATRRAESDLEAVAVQRRTLTEQVAEQSRELAQLETRRGDLERQVATADRTLETLRTERLELEGQVERTGTRLSDMQAERRTLTAEVNSARTELRTLTAEQERTLTKSKEERDEVVVSVRRNMPVTSVVKGNDRLVSALAERKITTTGALADMPDDEIKTLARASGTPVRTVTALRNTAGREIKAPVE